MNEWGGGPPEIEPDIAIIQARQRGPSASPGAGELPSTAFVAAINGLGGAVTLQSGTVPAGWTVTFTQGAGTVSLNISGPGTLSTKNIAAAIADLATVASAAYVQAEAQSVIDKLNALLGSLRTAGIIGP